MRFVLAYLVLDVWLKRSTPVSPECGHFIIINLAEPCSWKYRNLLCSFDANHLQISWRWTLFELIRLFQRRDSSFFSILILWEWKRLQSEICICQNVTCRWLKAIICRVFDHFANSPTNYRFFDTYLIASYQKGEENCLLDLSILTHELYVFTRKDLCFGTCRQVVYEMFIVWI